MRYSRVRDGIFNAEKAQQIAELELRYETQKKETPLNCLSANSKPNRLAQRLDCRRWNCIHWRTGNILPCSDRAHERQTNYWRCNKQLNTKLNEVNRLNSRFFANVSHELRHTAIIDPTLLEEIKKNKQLTAEEEKTCFLLMRRNAKPFVWLGQSIIDCQNWSWQNGFKSSRESCRAVLNHHLIAIRFGGRKLLLYSIFKNIHLNNEIIWFDQRQDRKDNHQLVFQCL